MVAKPHRHRLVALIALTGGGVLIDTPGLRSVGLHDDGDGVALTATREVLEAMASRRRPRRSVLALGYAGWAPGQLEGEIAANAWYTAPVDPALVFDMPRDKVWERAVERRTRDL